MAIFLYCACIISYLLFCFVHLWLFSFSVHCLKFCLYCLYIISLLLRLLFFAIWSDDINICLTCLVGLVTILPIFVMHILWKNWPLCTFIIVCFNSIVYPGPAVFSLDSYRRPFRFEYKLFETITLFKLAYLFFVSVHYNGLHHDCILGVIYWHMVIGFISFVE